MGSSMRRAAAACALAARVSSALQLPDGWVQTLQLPEDLASDLQGLADPDTATLLATFGVNFSALPERITRVIIDVGWTYSSLMGNLQETSNTLMLGFEASPFNWLRSLVKLDEHGPRMRCGATSSRNGLVLRIRSQISVKEHALVPISNGALPHFRKF